MGLLSKLLRRREAAASQPADTSQFEENDSTTEQQTGSRNAPRRELIHVVLRDAMRKHGIPSDWIDCRMMSVVTRRGATGMHVQFVVHQGHDDLLKYVYAFQESFLREIAKFDPQADKWLMSLSWQFEGTGITPGMPHPSKWSGAAPEPAPAAGQPAATAKPVDEDVEADLKALFAIRDAVLNDTSTDRPDFEPTRPGFEDSDPKRR